MRLLTWNTNFRSVACLDAIRAFRPDIVLFQEVKHKQAPDFRTALSALDCLHAAYSGLPTDPSKRYGNITASRWPVSKIAEWAPSMPWPQLALRATVQTPEGALDTINVHIPNGSANGWRKVESLEALATVLESAGDLPRVVAGDFNEPQTILPGGKIVSFGESIDANGIVQSGGRFTDKFGYEDDLERWASVVRRIFSDQAQHGLHHVVDLGSGGPFPATHVVRGGSPRFFDHLLVSRHLRVTNYVYVDSVREKLKHSDHSALYADIVFVPQSAQLGPALEWWVPLVSACVVRRCARVV
jgi:endonuclease/exonuclease/phosphatase family metal-dependent hydrolase